MSGMLTAFLGPSIILALVLIPMALVASLVVWRKRWEHSQKRRSPLTTDLLRPPGFGLQKRIEELSDDISSHLFSVGLVPLMLFGAYSTGSLIPHRGDSFILEAAYAIAGFILLVYLTQKLVRLMLEREKYRRALEGELATAQLLEPILAGGGHVYHDIQMGRGNIDHVVVAPGGVFTVETKHRLKPTEGNATKNARVTFDGKALHFPGWKETKLIEQARTQARVLSGLLTRSTGTSVQVHPIIALPGWYVDTSNRSDVVVINPKNCTFMLRPSRGEQVLGSKHIERIGYQVEQLCRLPASDKSENHRR